MDPTWSSRCPPVILQWSSNGLPWASRGLLVVLPWTSRGPFWKAAGDHGVRMGDDLGLTQLLLGLRQPRKDGMIGGMTG